MCLKTEEGVILTLVTYTGIGIFRCGIMVLNVTENLLQHIQTLFHLRYMNKELVGGNRFQKFTGILHFVLQVIVLILCRQGFLDLVIRIIQALAELLGTELENIHGRIRITA